MFKKHLVILGIATALALLFSSTAFYPGGSQYDENSVGFSWKHNYLSNLLNPVAVNHQDNAALQACFSCALPLRCSLSGFLKK